MQIPPPDQNRPRVFTSALFFCFLRITTAFLKSSEHFRGYNVTLNYSKLHAPHSSRPTLFFCVNLFCLTVYFCFLISYSLKIFLHALKSHSCYSEKLHHRFGTNYAICIFFLYLNLLHFNIKN